MPEIGLRFCLDQWLLRTYIPLTGLPHKSEVAASIGKLSIEAYRHRYALGAEDFRPVFVIIASGQISTAFIRSFRRYVKSNGRVLGYIFCLEKVPSAILDLPVGDKDYSVLVIDRELMAELFVAKGVGVRMHPLWQLDGPRWIIDEEFFKLVQTQRESKAR